MTPRLIYVAVPVYDGKPYAAMVDSLLAEQLFCQQHNAALYVDWLPGCSLIGAGRNLLSSRFLLMKQAREMVFVDADISWPPGSIWRLVASRHDVIGGTYRAKSPETHYHVMGPVRRLGRNYEVAGLPGGFIKITRRALDRIAEKTGQRFYGTSEGYMRDFFPMGWHRGRYYGEDYGFCRLWRQAGGKVILNADLALRHHDGGTVYTGDLRAWMKENHP